MFTFEWQIHANGRGFVVVLPLRYCRGDDRLRQMTERNGNRDRVRAILERCGDRGLDAHYLAFFDCFNEGLFFEAHEMLEVPWQADRKGPNAAFYKGLIQLAGAFVHLQKDRRGPARALFGLAKANLEKYPEFHESLDVGAVLGMISRWVQELESKQGEVNPLRMDNAPRLVAPTPQGRHPRI